MVEGTWDSDRRAASEDLFADFLRDGEQGLAPAFEELCRAHPANADDLRELQRDWARIEALREKADLGSVPGSAESEALLRRLLHEPVQDPDAAIHEAAPAPEPAEGSGGLGRLRSWVVRVLRGKKHSMG